VISRLGSQLYNEKCRHWSENVFCNQSLKYKYATDCERFKRYKYDMMSGKLFSLVSFFLDTKHFPHFPDFHLQKQLHTFNSIRYHNCGKCMEGTQRHYRYYKSTYCFLVTYSKLSLLLFSHLVLVVVISNKCWHCLIFMWFRQ
jgi:hypothetical protein